MSEYAALKGHTGWVNRVAFSPDGSRLASGGDDTVVKVWDAQDGRLLLAFKGHAHGVADVAFSPDGTLAVSCAGYRTGDGAGEVIVWDARTGAEVARLTGHRRGVCRL